MRKLFCLMSVTAILAAVVGCGGSGPAPAPKTETPPAETPATPAGEHK